MLENDDSGKRLRVLQILFLVLGVGTTLAAFLIPVKENSQSSTLVESKIIDRSPAAKQQALVEAKDSAKGVVVMSSTLSESPVEKAAPAKAEIKPENKIENKTPSVANTPKTAETSLESSNDTISEVKNEVVSEAEGEEDFLLPLAEAKKKATEKVFDPALFIAKPVEDVPCDLGYKLNSDYNCLDLCTNSLTKYKYCLEPKPVECTNSEITALEWTDDCNCQLTVSKICNRLSVSERSVVNKEECAIRSDHRCIAQNGLSVKIKTKSP